jgi:hypothetical protein
MHCALRFSFFLPSAELALTIPFACRLSSLGRGTQRLVVQSLQKIEQTDEEQSPRNLSRFPEAWRSAASFTGALPVLHRPVTPIARSITGLETVCGQRFPQVLLFLWELSPPAAL